MLPAMNNKDLLQLQDKYRHSTAGKGGQYLSPQSSPESTVQVLKYPLCKYDGMMMVPFLDNVQLVSCRREDVTREYL